MKNLIEEYVDAKFGSLRVLYIDGVPHFPAIDIAKSFEYSDTNGAIRKHVDAEDKIFVDAETFKKMAFQCNPAILTGLESPNGLILINESGLYSLILRWKFKRWVTAEVLPAIRAKGYYSFDDDAELLELAQKMPEPVWNKANASRS